MPVTGKMERIGGETDPFFHEIREKRERGKEGKSSSYLPFFILSVFSATSAVDFSFFLVTSQQRDLTAEGSEGAERRVRVFYREIHERRERNRGPLICLSIVSFLRVSVVYTLMAFL